MQAYFKGMGIVGWVHCQPGFGAFLMAKDESFHQEFFKEKWQVFFVIDTVDKLDSFYLYNREGAGLRQAKGYFIYYDRNREMQEYMLENSLVRPKEIEQQAVGGAAEEEKDAFDVRTLREQQEERRRIQMDAAQDIRRVLRRRENAAKEAKRERDRLLAAVCCVLCVVCISLGVAMLRSLDRLQTVERELLVMQTSYQTLSEEMEGALAQSVFAVQSLQEEAKETEEADKSRKYLVERGDSLGYISRKFYGDNSGIIEIMEMNGLQNADMIYEGQILWIPE